MNVTRTFRWLARRALIFGAIIGAGMAAYALAVHAGIDGASTVRRVALEEGVPAKLALAVASVESGLDCEAPDSPAGAVGIMQTMPATAAAMGVSRAELLTCEGAARAGVRYLKAALDRTDGDRASAAHLYFAGLNAEPTRSSAYARAVMAAMHRF